MRLDKVEKEINQFKLIMLGENFIKKIKTQNFIEFEEEFFEFLKKIENEGDFENTLIDETYKKIINEYKAIISQ